MMIRFSISPRMLLSTPDQTELNLISTKYTKNIYKVMSRLAEAVKLALLRCRSGLNIRMQHLGPARKEHKFQHILINQS